MIKKNTNNFYRINNGFREYYDINSNSFKKIAGQDGFVILKNTRKIK